SRSRSRAPGGGGRASKQQEPAAPHSMTSSARARIDGGTTRTSALGVLRLTTKSSLLGCRIDRSLAISAARIRPVYWPATRFFSVTVAPSLIRPPAVANPRWNRLSEANRGQRAWRSDRAALKIRIGGDHLS